jgi:1-acyl-sn-glycerol-3-phosphate acyltransferase
MRTLFSTCYWGYLSLTAIVLYLGALVLWAVTYLFDPTGRVLHRYTCWWATLYLRCLPGCRLRVEGRDKIRPGVAYLLCANHQSMTDIMALSALHVQFKWVSKKEAFRLPCIGWNMYLNRYICVDRGNIRNVRATMETCRSWLERGVPLMMFPEGKRSLDGELQEFHGGAFKLAFDTGCAVVPIVIDGTFPIFRGFQVCAFPGTVTIRVLDPIEVKEHGTDRHSLGKFTDDVFHCIKTELAEIRRRKAEVAGQKSEIRDQQSQSVVDPT